MRRGNLRRGWERLGGVEATESLGTRNGSDSSTHDEPRDLRTRAPGGPDDFAEFFASTWPRAYRIAYAVAGDAGRAEDACQAAFARAYVSWRRVRAADRPEAYVRRMVLNEVLDQRRRAWRRHEQSHAEPGLVQRREVSESDLTGYQVTDREALWAAVATLPPRQRAVIVLRYYEDLSEREIADVLSCSSGTVKSQASRALAALRRHAADETTGDLR